MEAYANGPGAGAITGWDWRVVEAPLGDGSALIAPPNGAATLLWTPWVGQYRVAADPIGAHARICRPAEGVIWAYPYATQVELSWTGPGTLSIHLLQGEDWQALAYTPFDAWSGNPAANWGAPGPSDDPIMVADGVATQVMMASPWSAASAAQPLTLLVARGHDASDAPALATVRVAAYNVMPDPRDDVQYVRSGISLGAGQAWVVATLPAPGMLVPATDPKTDWPTVVPMPPAPASSVGWRRLDGRTFFRGSPEDEACRAEDEARHAVTLTRALQVAETEVTQAEWSALMPVNPSVHSGCPACPVENVTWYESLEYANRRSASEGLEPCYVLTACTGEVGAGMVCDDAKFEGLDCPGLRLPTEAEWEYAARAGTITAYWTGPSDEATCDGAAPRVDLAAWCAGPAGAGGTTHEVGALSRNPWGLQDVHGNVAEWVWDGYGAYPAGTALDPTGPAAGGGSRVVRGGAFDEPPRGCRSASRAAVPAGERRPGVGLRLVRTGG